MKDAASLSERKSRSVWYVYMLRCADGTLYTGTARDVERRFAQHSAGRGAKYTRGRGPLAVVYREPCAGKSAALKREAAVKKMTRARKLALAGSSGPRGKQFTKDAESGKMKTV